MTANAGKTRLGRTDWVLAGYRALTEGGAAALKVEVLARAIGATKGSFYWHFKDMADLQAEMLALWEQQATAEITAAVQRSGRDPRGQMLLLVDLVSVVPRPELGGVEVEPALRDWGRTDARARRSLERVDRQRIADVTGFLRAAGVTDPEAGALVIYATVIGLENLRMTMGAEMRAPLRALVERLLDG
jgi:AcrR family transcriptional regulator